VPHRLLREMPLLGFFVFADRSTHLSVGHSNPNRELRSVIDITRRDLGEVFAGEELEYAFSSCATRNKPLDLPRNAPRLLNRAVPVHPVTCNVAPCDRVFTRAVAPCERRELMPSC